MSSSTQGQLSKRQKIINLAVYGSIEGLDNGTAQTRIARLASTTPTTHDSDRVKLANVLGDALDDNVDLAAEILQDDNIKSTRDLALHYGFSRVRTLTFTRKESLLLTPSSAPKADEFGAHSAPSQQDSFSGEFLALRFRRRLFAAEPTAVLQHMVHSNDAKKNPSDELPVHASTTVRAEVAGFLDRRPDFDIRRTSIMSALETGSSEMDHLDMNTKAAVVESLKLLQRVQALTPVPELIQPLLEDGFKSGLRVSSISKKSFVARMGPKLAGSASISQEESEALFSQVHDHATAGRLRIDRALVQIREMVGGTGLRSIDGNSVLSQRKAMFNEAREATNTPLNVNLDALFDDMDMCECEDCLDVTSPTAYYVDLLQYLRNNDLDDSAEWHNTGQEGIEGTALEQLFARRPDLQHLQLTCSNANTALPMIDLANEVMEAFVIHLTTYESTGKAKIETWNIRRETTDELLASPSNTRKKAYCILKHAVYPLALPYFQPLDACRLYMSYLGTSRFDLIDTFRLAQRQWVVSPRLLGSPEKKARYAELRSKVQDRAAAAEYLGISPDLYVILTRESLWPIECSEFADNGLALDQHQYQKDIGVVNAYLYWGYDSEAALLSEATDNGLSFVKAQFLPRSVLSFAETAELARTRYVNPMMPTGKDRILLNSIRFSYRFLQHMVVGKSGDERTAALASFLFCTQAWTNHILNKEIPPTGNDLVKPDIVTTTFTYAEIRAWVAKWFDCVGKLTVLESGQGPRLALPYSGYLVWLPSTPKDASIVSAAGSGEMVNKDGKVLGYLDQTGELDDENDQLVGFVWTDGKVYLAGPKPAHDVYSTGRILFFPMEKLQKGKTPSIDVFKSRRATGLVGEDSKLQIQGYAGREPTIVHWLPGVETCSIDKTRLIHLNGTPLELWEWDRINRFIRLYKVMQAFEWTIMELDTALVGAKPGTSGSRGAAGSPPPGTTVTGFSFSNFKDKPCSDETSSDYDCGGGDGDKPGTSPCDRSNYPEITSYFIEQLMSIQKLFRHTGLELTKLLCLWADIDTFGEKSLYSRLFLTHDLESMDNVFIPDANGNYLTF